MTLPSFLAALLNPAAYPHPVEKVELIETHTSWVLLAGELAYKLKRPVHYSFIDMRDPGRRKQLCEKELCLNRRLAPELYLGICRIVSTPAGARIGGDGPVLEHAVCMRRFPAADQLDRLLADRRIEPGELTAFGRHLASIHATLPAAHADRPWGHPAHVEALIKRNLVECAEAAQPLGQCGPVLALCQPLHERLSQAAAVMAARRANGHIRECHGDLHSRNIVRLGSGLTPFDCLEYEPAFRWIDTADEIAFLASDLAVRERPAHAHAFLAGYLEESGDYQACQVLRLYEAHRALVRAKVAALAATELPSGSRRDALLDEHASLLAHAARSLRRSTPVLLLMHGLSGSGKTWLASQLVQPLRAFHIRSDVERRRHSGLPPGVRSGSGLNEGLYARDAGIDVYAQLARAAENILAGGRSVLVDATFLSRDQRAPFAALAARLGVPVHLVCCSAPEPVLRTRILARQAAGSDPSEADQAVLSWQQTQQEPPGNDEPFHMIQANTAEPGVVDRVLAALAAAADEQSRPRLAAAP